jgi:hypothetical protein
MKEDFTDIVVILDRSGSMAAIRKDTEGGFDTFVGAQRLLPGECNLNLYQFDDKYEVVYENKPIGEVKKLKLNPRGSTALLDAIGKTINTRGQYYASLEEDERPAKVIFVIITDGEENVSQEYSFDSVKQLVTQQTEQYSWEFVFLGANIDAIDVAGHMGIGAHTSLTYGANAKGVGSSYTSMSNAVSVMRCSAAPYSGFSNTEREEAKGSE